MGIVTVIAIFWSYHVWVAKKVNNLEFSLLHWPLKTPKIKRPVKNNKQNPQSSSLKIFAILSTEKFQKNMRLTMFLLFWSL